MKIKKGLFLLIALACIVISTLSPRFGYSIQGLTENEGIRFFDYQGSAKKDKQTIVTYQYKDGSTVVISYEGRFSRKLVLTHSNAHQITIFPRIDGGCPNVTAPSSALYASEHSIIAQDASNFFYWVYLRSILFILLAISFYQQYEKRKNNELVSKFAKRILFGISIGLLVLAVLASARFPLCFYL